MLNSSDICTAARFGFLEEIKRFQAAILALDGVVDIEYDLSGFVSDIHEVIFLPKFLIGHAGTESYFERRKELLRTILAVAKQNGLTRTGDRIENYGDAFYIVMDCPWAKSTESHIG